MNFPRWIIPPSTNHPTQAARFLAIGRLGASGQQSKAADKRECEEVASKVLQRPEPPPKGFRSLRYFDDAIRDEINARAQPAAVPALGKPEDPIQEAGRRAWSAELEAWRQGGCVGRMPPRLDQFIERARETAA